MVALPLDDIDNLDYDKELAAALGNMIVVWARAETALVCAYSVVTKMHYNDAAAIYYNIPTFESRTRALQAMIDERPNPFPNRLALADAVAALVNLATARNGWVHALWVSPRKTQSTRVLNMKKRSAVRKAKQVNANAVRQHNKAVRDATVALEIFSPVKIALRASP